MGTTLLDFRFAVRQLRKQPGFTFTAIAVFTLGVAASTAIFAFVDVALIRPLPYRAPSRLVALYERVPVGERYHLSNFDYLEWKRSNRSFSSLDAYRPDSFALTTVDTPEAVPGARVSDGFFRTLGVAPFLGRDFRSGEDQKAAQPVVILSYATWQKRFAASKTILGQSITLDGVPSLVVGVLPRGFHFAPVEPAEFWTTLHGFCEAMPHDCHGLYGVARLKDGVSGAAASADLTSIAVQIAAQYPHSNRDRNALLIPLVDAILGDVRPTLVALLVGAGLLSLIGSVNVLSLLLLRAEGRRREMAVRAALGAGRARLVAQFTVEGFLLEMRDRRNNLQMCRIGRWRVGSVPQWMVAEDHGQSWGEFIGKDQRAFRQALPSSGKSLGVISSRVSVVHCSSDRAQSKVEVRGIPHLPKPGRYGAPIIGYRLRKAGL